MQDLNSFLGRKPVATHNKAATASITVCAGNQKQDTVSEIFNLRKTNQICLNPLLLPKQKTNRGGRPTKKKNRLKRCWVTCLLLVVLTAQSQ